MKATELRQSILQMAVQGKLVPQDLHDEPASELLARIKTEKAQLIKDGKIKKEKSLTPITEDDIPYDIPGGWRWCRFGEVVINRDGERKPVSKDERSKLAKIYDYYGASGVIDKIDSYLFDKPLLLIGEDGANLLARSTPIAFFAEGKYWVNNHAHVLDGICYEFLNYLRIFINSIDLSPYVTGTAQPKMNQEKMNSIPIAIPPFSEQQRIVAKVDELMAMCDELEAAEKELEKLESDFIEYLPKSILQMAVQGKLAPQNIHDEPADKLLERIRAEKTQLIKDGEIKKEKPLPPITEDDVPYDLPDGWVWCRLGDVGEIIGGATPSSSDSSLYTNPGDGIAWITPADMKMTTNRIIMRGQKDITQAGYDSCSTRLLPKDSIVFSSRAPIGHIAFAGGELCTNQGFKSIVPINMSTREWIYYCLIHKTEDITSRASGTTFKEVSGEFVKQEIIPLPPLAEQQRIVAKVDELMALCDELKAVKDISVSPVAPKVIPFPVQDDAEGEEIRIAARGDVQGLSDEAMRDIDELFGDDVND